MTFLIIAAIALAVVAGFWYSYYQSLKKLRAHDRETVRLMERDLKRMRESGASTDTLDGFQRRIDEFRAKHKVT